MRAARSNLYRHYPGARALLAHLPRLCRGRARFESPLAFPYSFSLTTANLTPEFAGVDRSAWEGADLVITARYDTDGVAATRGPDE